MKVVCVVWFEVRLMTGLGKRKVVLGSGRENRTKAHSHLPTAGAYRF